MRIAGLCKLEVQRLTELRRPTRSRRAVLAVALLAGVIALAACSSEGPVAEAPATAASGTASTTTVPDPAAATSSTASPSITTTEAPTTTTTQAGTAVELVRIIDGDTIEVAMPDGSTETVRYIGIDTPETKHPAKPVEWMGPEASAYNEGLLRQGPLRLEFDVQERDQYGRLLAYVYAGDVFVNRRLVLDGYAAVSTYPPNVRHVEQFEDAQRKAQEGGAGLWAPTTTAPPAAAGSGAPVIEIASMNPDAPGNDHENLNEEWIGFRVAQTASLAGYSVEDEANHVYHFPDRTFEAGQEFRLHTGSGGDSGSDLYWASDGAVWNNDGDTVTVRAPGGAVVAQQSY